MSIVGHNNTNYTDATQEDYSSINNNLLINGEAVEFVNQFIYFDIMVNNQSDDSMDIKRRIAIVRSATVFLTSIWRNKAVGKKTKIRLL